MARKRKRRQGRAQLKVRLPEALRREIETAAAKRGHSMNTEIVERLLVFDITRDAKQLVAQALLDTLDDKIINHIVAEVRQRQLDKEQLDKEQLDKEQLDKEQLRKEQLDKAQLDKERWKAERDKE